MEHPVKVLLRNGLPEVGFMVVRHGFGYGGRDYVFLLEDSAGRYAETYELTLTDVEGLTCSPRPGSSTGVFAMQEDAIDIDVWTAAPEQAAGPGGAGWSVAYPGISIGTGETQDGSRRSGHPSHAVAIETEVCLISLIFSEARLKLLTPQSQTVQALFIPLPQGE